MSDTKRIAVIGAGFMGSMHASIFARLRGCELAAIVEVSLLSLGPATEHLIDGEKFQGREVLLVLRERCGRARASHGRALT